MTQIDVTFSGQVNAAQADKSRLYHLAYTGKQGSHTAGNAVVVKLRSAKYNAATDTCHAHSEQAVRTQGPGRSSSRSTERPHPVSRTSSGRYLDGADNGQAGSNAVVSISKNGVNIE